MNIKIEDLKKNPNNPRIIKDEGFNKLKESLQSSKGKEHFDARPCIVSTRTGENIIIAGNTRFQAAKELGWKEVPTVIMEGLTEDQENEIIIRDNVNNGDWDTAMLLNWDREKLEEWGADVFFENDIDYSILDDDKEELEKQIDDIYRNTKKAIVVEFELELYNEAANLNKELKEQGVNIGLLLLDAMRNKI